MGIAIAVVPGLAVGIAFIVALSIALDTGSAQPNPSHLNVSITLERTACFGSCPVYSLVIYGNGTVNYDGRGNVAVTGKQSSIISKGDMQKLLKEADEIGYFGLKDEYMEPISDLPTTITSITTEGANKKIVDYAGAPDSLMDFEQKIDQISGSAKWVKCPDGRIISMDPNVGCRQR